MVIHQRISVVNRFLEAVLFLRILRTAEGLDLKTSRLDDAVIRDDGRWRLDIEHLDFSAASSPFGPGLRIDNPVL